MTNSSNRNRLTENPIFKRRHCLRHHLNPKIELRKEKSFLSRDCGAGAKSGPLSRREAARIVATRAALMAETAVEGGMTAVRASAAECAAAIEAT